MTQRFGVATLLLMLSYATSYSCAQSPARSSETSIDSRVKVPSPLGIPPLPKDAAGILSLAKKYNGLDAPGLKPWQIIINYETFDDEGKSSAKGTFVESWLGDGNYKRSYTSSSFTQTEFKTSDGRYRIGDLDSPPYPEMLVEELLLHPLPSDAEIQDSAPERRALDAGQLKLECVMLSQTLTHLASAPLGLFPTYCFSSSLLMLRVAFLLAETRVTFNGLATFQGHYLARDVHVQDGKHPLLKTHIAQLAVFSSLDPADFTPPPGAYITGKHPIQVAAEIEHENLLKQERPVYPDDARRNRIGGTVVLDARIGSDGHVRDLRLISAPDSSFAISAIAAVRKWAYKPYKLNGEAVEIETTIEVIYKIN